MLKDILEKFNKELGGIGIWGEEKEKVLIILSKSIKQAFEESDKIVVKKNHIDINEEYVKSKIGEILKENMTEADKRYYIGIGVGYLEGYNQALKDQKQKQSEWLGEK